jgi:hypothetical protein
VVVRNGTKCHIFLSWVTMTHIVSYPSDHGSPVLKSIKILVHGFDGMERDLRVLAKCCHKVCLH